MKKIPFIIFKALVWLVALLPLKVLYVFSWFLYIILFYIARYRTNVALTNLTNSFPDKSSVELKSIRKKYYHYFADLIVEDLKLRHISKDELHKRFKIVNPELMNDYSKKGRDVIAVFGHYGNWEWMAATQSHIKHRMLVIYKPLSSEQFNKYLLSLRTKFGLELVPMNLTLRSILGYKKEGIYTATGLLADQTPPSGEIQYWTKFLNQDTAVFLGVEKLAHKFNMPVFFLDVKRVKRGYYELTMELIAENPNELKELELTDMHIARLEKQIIEQPEYWLWSHRRWKHKKPNTV